MAEPGTDHVGALVALSAAVSALSIAMTKIVDKLRLGVRKPQGPPDLSAMRLLLQEEERARRVDDKLQTLVVQNTRQSEQLEETNGLLRRLLEKLDRTDPRDGA